MRRLTIAATLTCFVALVLATSGAQATVVAMGAAGKAGIAPVPGSNLSGLPTVTASPPCTDPALSSEFTLPDTGLCWHGGPVMHNNETFDLAWDPLRRDWATTRNYVEQFLRDVADASGTLTSPYAVTTQYTDGAGRAGKSSLYGGGCIDYGGAGGSCQFGNTNGSGPGHSYPSSGGCSANPSKGSNYFHEELSGAFDTAPNDVCLTDAQLQGELATMIAQSGLHGHIQPGYAPLLVLMTPPGVEVCLDASATLCSANGALAPPTPTVSSTDTGGTIAAGTYQVEVTYVTASGETVPSASQSVTTTGSSSTITINSPPPASGATGWYAYVTQAAGKNYARQQATPTPIGTPLALTSGPTQTGPPPSSLAAPSFCSYHSQVGVGGTEYAYVVQPWSALTRCDEPDAPAIPQNPSPETLAVNVGIRLASPLSQAQIGAITDPAMNGWFALGGAEINDNGCVPFANGLDNVSVGGSRQNPYLLQREFNNGGVIESDPNALSCEPSVVLTPKFVVPSNVNPGDVVEFDGSKTVSTLVVPRAGDTWNFGDGTTAVGASVVHSYAKPGTYSVTLTVTDRGGNVRSLSQTIEALGPGGGPPSGSSGGLHVRLQLMPQSLRSVLSYGVAVRVSSNRAADGIAMLSISRRAARRAHVRLGRGPSVVVGRGTVSGIKNGTVKLHLRLSKAVAAKLVGLRHLTLTVRLGVIAAGGERVSIDAAGRY